jgi:hypothetical protein
MRDASNSVSLMANIQRRIEVTVMRKATAPTTKRRLMPLSPLDMSTMRAGRASVRWTYHRDSKAGYRRKQQHSLPEEAGGVFLPANQPFGIFQGNASSRAMCHGHSLSGLTGNDLSRRTHRAVSVPPLFCVILFPLIIATEHGAQVWPFVAVRACDSGAGSNVTTEPTFWGLHFRQRHGDRNPSVPLAVFSEDLRRFVQLSAWKNQRSIDSDMSLSGNIEAAVTPLRRRGSPQHDPQVKSFCFAGLLNLGAVDQFRFQQSGYMSRLGGPAIVDIGTAICPTNELPQSFCRRASSPLRLRNLECAIRVRSTKEARQESQRIGFIDSGIQANFIRQVHGLHVSNITNAATKENPLQERRLVRAGQSALDASSDSGLTASVVWRVRPPTADRHARPALLGGFARPHLPRDHAGSLVRTLDGSAQSHESLREHSRVSRIRSRTELALILASVRSTSLANQSASIFTITLHKSICEHSFH